MQSQKPCRPAAHGAARGGRRVAAALADVARGRPGARLGPAERHAMALTQGLAHGAAHSFIFYFRSASCALAPGGHGPQCAARSAPGAEQPPRQT